MAVNWKYKALDELGTVSRGRSKHRPRNDPKLFGGAYPFIQTADVKKADYYINQYSETYNELGLAQSKLWEAGTLCITIAANIADTAVLAFPACFPDSVMGFVPFKDVANTRFVKACFDILQKDCKQISQGTAQDNLSWEKLSTIRFPAPPYNIQCCIADILSAYDNLIENNRKQIKLLEEAAQRLYKEWFVDLRFPGWETTQIVDGVPVGWKTSSINELGHFVRGKTITKSNVNGGDIPVVAGGIEPAYYHNVPNTEMPVITISGSGANAGFTRIYFQKIWASDCSYVDSNGTRYIYFVYCFLKNSGDAIKKLQKGSAQPHVYAKDINALTVTIPNMKMLQSFEEHVRPCFNAIANGNKIIMSATEARDRLLPKLMSGELRV